MLCEVVNALFVTFLASEYLLSLTNDDHHLSHSSSDGAGIGDLVTWILAQARRSRPIRLGFIAVLAINLFSRFHFTGAALVELTDEVAASLFHVPRVVIAAVAFAFALFLDCRRVARSLTVWKFLWRLGGAFCRVAPIYPFLAVLISFGFMFIISAFEKLNLPLELLNDPIYYGTLYGPFGFMYWDVKKAVAKDRTSLPSVSSSSDGGRVLGRK